MRGPIGRSHLPWSVDWRASRPIAAAAAILVVIAIAYPSIAERTQHPLAVFAVPILVAAAGTWRNTLVVGATAFGVATVEGVLSSYSGSLSGSLSIEALLVQLVIIGACWLIGVFVAAKRERRDRAIAQAATQTARISRAMHVGRVGAWHWDQLADSVDWDADVHALFGVQVGEFDGTFESWVELIHPDDRESVLSELHSGLTAKGVFGFDHRCVWPDGSVHWIQGVGEVTTDEAGEVIGAIGLALNVDERKRLIDIETRARDRFEYLDRTNRALVESLDTGEVIDRITSAAVPQLADWCVVVVSMDCPREDPLISVAHSDPEMVKYARQLQERFPYDPDAPYGVSEVIRTQTSQYVAVIDEAFFEAAVPDPELRDLAIGLELRSLIIVPLVGGIGTLGALQLVRTSARPAFTPADLLLAEDIAGSIGAALNNAILFRRQQAGRRALQGLQQLTAALAEASTVTDIGATVVRAGSAQVSADRALLYLAAVDGTYELEAQIGYEAHELDPWKVLHPSSVAPIPDAIRTRQLVVLSNQREMQQRYPRMVTGPRSGSAAIAVPLILRGRVVGGLYYAWNEAHEISDTELDLLQNIASRCTGALERARLYEQQRNIADTLQKSLLPAKISGPDWLELDARYWTADTGSDVGGDFYDILRVHDDRWAIMIGDVCGKGAEAAALTAVARHTARAVARHTTSPTQVLEDVHLALQEFDGNNYCTVCFAFLERDPSGAVHVSIALGGHPPPLLRRRDGTIEQLGLPGTLLGLITPTLHTSQAVMQPGDTIVLYTDGVTDAPVDLAVGVDDFAAVVMQSGEEPSSITTAVRAMLVERRPNGVVDDTALLVAKVVRPAIELGTAADALGA